MWHSALGAGRATCETRTPLDALPPLQATSSWMLWVCVFVWRGCPRCMGGQPRRTCTGGAGAGRAVGYTSRLPQTQPYRRNAVVEGLQVANCDRLEGVEAPEGPRLSCIQSSKAG